MKFISGCLWESAKADKSEESLLLLQARQNGRFVVFAFLCNGREAGGYVTGRLKTWFYEEGAVLCGQRKESSAVEQALSGKLKELFRETDSYRLHMQSGERLSVGGILIADQSFF